jgi:hypothetical protein
MLRIAIRLTASFVCDVNAVVNTEMDFTVVLLVLFAMQMPSQALHNNHRAKRLVPDTDVGGYCIVDNWYCI